MDVAFFLKDRTRMIRHYYETVSHPFQETMRKIDAEEEPFVPPYSEDSEPAFLTEWLEAREYLEVTGRCCLSVLAASLRLFFRNWEQQLGLKCNTMAKAEFKTGMIHGYKACFEQLGIDWAVCPANLGIIEQVVLARNRDQHPENIWTLGVTHGNDDRNRYPSPFFLHDEERGLLDDDPEGGWMTAYIHVSPENLEIAIAEVEALGDWLEDKLVRVQYPNYRGE